jgi:hypothetical protein
MLELILAWFYTTIDTAAEAVANFTDGSGNITYGLFNNLADQLSASGLREDSLAHVKHAENKAVPVILASISLAIVLAVVMTMIFNKPHPD